MTTQSNGGRRSTGGSAALGLKTKTSSESLTCKQDCTQDLALSIHPALFTLSRHWMFCSSRVLEHIYIYMDMSVTKTLELDYLYVGRDMPITYTAGVLGLGLDTDGAILL